MAILGGSPLGLIGLSSGPKGGRSGFNGGNSRNVNVNAYNKSEDGSLFSGKRRLRAWPNLSGKISKSFKIDQDGNFDKKSEPIIEDDTTGLSDVGIFDAKPKDGYVPLMGSASGSNLLHNNDVYDTSVLNLVEKLAGTIAALRPTDFAYLKDLGVYPNNRLMIARRFLGPVGDNIMRKSNKKFPAVATLISWRPEGDDFLEIQFGEEWEPAKADFTGLLNAIGDDFMKGGAGKIASAAANIVPLPGFTEIFQRVFLEKLGLLEEGAANQIPSGNPNLIKEAKRRKTVGYSEAGSGLMAKVSIKMVCEYELKFISGIDPTMVWMDLLGMIVRFGTSESSNYGLSSKVASRLASWANDPKNLITDVINVVKATIKKAVKELTSKIIEVFNAATKAAKELMDEEGASGTSGTSGTSAKKEKTPGELAQDAAVAAKNAGNAMLKGLTKFAEKAVKGTILKYRVEMMGIVSALTGAASTPWHITIGNPLRPVFCSGDMLTTEVTLKLGSTLAFNDLPSSITVEFTLTNARNWGLQEIMAKFNSGYLRTVDVQRSYFETNITIDSKTNNITEESTGSSLLTTTYSTTTYGNKTEPAIVGVSPSGEPFGPKTEEQTKSEGNGFPKGPTL
jgi:hypothetical protein